MFIQYPGHLSDPQGTYGRCQCKLIDIQRGKAVITNENYSVYHYLVPISSLPLTRYYFTDSYGNVSEFKQIGGDSDTEYSNEYPFFESTDAWHSKYIWRGGDGSLGYFNGKYLMNTDYLVPGTTPIYGTFVDLSGTNFYFGTPDFIANLSGTGLDNFLGDYYRFILTENNGLYQSFYGDLSMSSLLDGNEVLSCRTLYGVYTNGEESEVVGDEIYSYTNLDRKDGRFTWNKRGSTQTNHKTYSYYFDVYNYKYVRNDISINYESENDIYIIGTRGISPWYEGDSLPSPTNSPVTFRPDNGGEPLIISFLQYNSFYDSIKRSATTDLANDFKNDFETQVLIADPWRWLK